MKTPTHTHPKKAGLKHRNARVTPQVVSAHVNSRLKRLDSFPSNFLVCNCHGPISAQRTSHLGSPSIWDRILGSELLKPRCWGQTLGSIFREKQRGVENSGEGKTYHKTPSQKMFWTPPPPPMIRFAPPRLFSPCCCPYRKPAQTRQIPLSEASKTGFGGRTLWYVFPPPKIARYVLPPPISRFPNFCCQILKSDPSPFASPFLWHNEKMACRYTHQQVSRPFFHPQPRFPVPVRFLGQPALSVVLDREWPGCPAIWAGTLCEKTLG